MACQMANAVYDSISVAVEAGDHEFRASSSSLKFSGYTAVYEEGRDEEKEEKTHALPPLSEGQGLHCRGFEKDQHFTQPPARYTDATLIRPWRKTASAAPLPTPPLCPRSWTGSTW